MVAVVGLRTKRSRIITGVVSVLVLVFVGFSVRLFVLPDLNAPERSNAIVMLGGNGVGPFDEAVALADQGWAPNVVFSLTPYQTCDPSIVHLPPFHLPRKDRVFCFQADPRTTQGEARAIAHLAALHHWDRVIVVMPTTQATRARLRIGRCYPGQVLEVGVAPPGFWAWIRGITYEWGALFKALVLQPGC
jgi:hypothetical protein